MTVLYVAISVHHSWNDGKPNEVQSKDYWEAFLKQYFNAFNDYGEGIYDWKVIGTSSDFSEVYDRCMESCKKRSDKAINQHRILNEYFR